ncbi:MAG: hypothetical protein V7735_25600 [Photobacterium frigidiphilum]|uniref:hypothetical protein n=1 Tax=Photobacterium frigidiphilum TaxID=264736 RepID=UPI0030028B78
MKYLLPTLLLTIFSTSLFASDYLSTSPANNMPNENGQFVYSSSTKQSFNQSIYISNSPIGSLPSKQGLFIVYPSNPCTDGCTKKGYISTSPANNIPNENGQYLYSTGDL